MNKNPIMMILGISLLVGVLTAVIFQETKYYQMLREPREISQSEYISHKEDSSCYNCAEMVTEKKSINYEVGGLTAVTLFAGLLIFVNLKKSRQQQ